MYILAGQRSEVRGQRSKAFVICAAVSALVLISGCQTLDVESDTETREIPESVLKARELFENDDLSKAIIACTEIYRKDPLTPGLGQLQTEITERLAELRKRNTTKKQPVSDAIAIEDAERQGILPDTYRFRKHVVGETAPIHTLSPEVQKQINKPYTIHLDNVTLGEIVSQIGSTGNQPAINIVYGLADNPQYASKRMSIHVDNAPLSEILEYVGRNLNVTFSVGNSLIWVTPNTNDENGPPMYTRIYRLRKGLGSDELVDALGTNSTANAGNKGESSYKLGIIGAITRFVPQPEGAEIAFNKRTHAILIKNTRENLALVEDIIEVLDVTPPQVLIEARFITTEVTDISELGVDWFLDSNWSNSRHKEEKFRTQVVGGTGNELGLSGATIRQTAFGDNALNGLNLTYQGLLTDPQFHAVLHALQSEGSTKTLSIPRVTTVNDTEARVRIGKDIRYFEDYDIEDVRTGTGINGNEIYESRLVPNGSPKVEKVGIELVVTPSVGADMSTISLKLAPQISDVTSWEYWDTSSSSSSTNSATGMIKLPIISKSEVNTEVQVRSGETVVMGGLVRSQKTKSTAGVPVLSKIPLIGRLFRHDVISDETSNLLIFVTATLISDSGEELIPLTPAEEEKSDKVELGINTPEVPQEKK